MSPGFGWRNIPSFAEAPASNFRGVDERGKGLPLTKAQAITAIQRNH